GVGLGRPSLVKVVNSRYLDWMTSLKLGALRFAFASRVRGLPSISPIVKKVKHNANLCSSRRRGGDRLAPRLTVDSLGSEFAAVAAVLDTAERCRRVHDVALVDAEGAGPHPR